MIADAAASWSQTYERSAMAYPSEGLIRIFRGEFPNLPNLAFHEGETILDLGCGDGRQVPLYSEKKLISTGVEIAPAICTLATANAQRLGIEFPCIVGHSANIPLPNGSFDYLVAWNSCYYMGLVNSDFDTHVTEMRRVLRAGGWLIASVPMASNFIFRGIDDLESPYVTIVDDFFEMRAGERMRRFYDRDDLIRSFSPHFSKIEIAEQRGDWFGLNYDWFTMVASAR